MTIDNQAELADINRKKLKIAKKKLERFDLSKVKPGDILFDPVYRYIRVESLPSTTSNNDDAKDIKWECCKLQSK